MSRGTKFVLFIVLLIIIAVVYLGIKGKDKLFAKYIHSSILLTEKTIEPVSLGELKVSLTNSDVYLSNSSDSNIYVKVYGQEGQKVDVDYNEFTLTISEPQKYECEGICLGNKVEISIPDSYFPSIYLSLTSGDVKSELTNNLIYDIFVTSGDVRLKDTHSSRIITTSGDIFINSVTDYINISGTSSDVRIDHFTAQEDSNIKVTDGDITIDDFEGAQVYAHSRSGDVNVDQDQNSMNKVTIQTTSGDITVIKKH